MKKLKQILSLFLLAKPLIAFAHGEEVFVTLFLELVVIVFLVIALTTINLNIKGKFILGSIGILAILLTSITTNSLPYMKYRNMIDVMMLVVPLLIVAITYVGLKSKFPKE